MQRISLANTDLVLSRLGFGTASLHHLAAARERAELLFTAFEHGITHFDTSPYYGHGLAESSLAAFAREPMVTIATKVGLYGPGGGDQGRIELLARKALGRCLPSLSRPVVDFTVRRARQSLNDSLRRLRRTRVDLLLLHEPRIELLATDEWLRWLEDARDTIRQVGVAGEAASILPLVGARSPLASVIQTRDSASGDEARRLRDSGCAPHLTYGHLSPRRHGRGAVDVQRALAAAAPRTVLILGTRRSEHIAAWTRGLAAAAPAASLAAQCS